jgi:hypothetical protein
MFIEGSAITGMSGGGAFDTDGRVVGILVRASTEHPTRQFVRAVRMSYVVARVRQAVEALEPDRRQAVETYLGSLD